MSTPLRARALDLSLSAARSTSEGESRTWHCARPQRTFVSRGLRALLPLLLVLLLLPGRPADAASAPLQYDIKLTLDYPSASATVQETVRYVNRTGARLTTIALNVTPIHFGAFSLDSAAVNGQPVSATFDDVTMELPLPSPLEVGDGVEVQIAYRLKVPTKGNLRFGRANDVLAFGNWHPTVEIARDGRWTRYPYTGVGDAFFTESADYDVALTVTGAPASLEVAHSGDLVARDGNTWTFRARQIRDFALAISDRYQTRSQMVGSTAVTVYYLPEHAAAGAQMLRSAVASLNWASEHLGPYPYSSLQVAETVDVSGTGQEYPNLVFIATGAMTGPAAPGSYLDYTVAHEVIHQWLYAMVGNDQIREPWLDEGPTTHLSYMYLRATTPDAYRTMWANMLQTHRSAVAAWGDRPLDSSIHDFQSDTQYFALLYRKGALLMDDLRQRLGDEAYFALLRDYVATYRDRIATTDDFLRLVQSRLPDEAPALAAKYFSPAVARSAFESASPTPAPATAEPSPAPSATSTATAAPAGRPSATPTPVASPTVASETAASTPIATSTATASAPVATSTPTPIQPPTAVPTEPPTAVATELPTQTPAATPTAAAPSPTPVPSQPPVTSQPAETSAGPLSPALVVGALLLVGLGGLATYARTRRP